MCMNIASQCEILKTQAYELLYIIRSVSFARCVVVLMFVFYRKVHQLEYADIGIHVMTIILARSVTGILVLKNLVPDGNFR